MGTWGFRVGEDDTFCDVRDFFLTNYNQGASPEDASKLVLDDMKDYFSDIDDRYEAYLALAFIQWETKYRDEQVFEEVGRFISNGESLKNWVERGGEASLIDKRRAELNSFLKMISKPRASRRRRSRKVPKVSEIKLIELLAPDNFKVLQISKVYEGERFVHVSAVVFWADGGGSIFHSEREDLEVAAEWENANNLKVSFSNAVESELNFGVGNPNEAFYCGDRVSIQYTYRS